MAGVLTLEEEDGTPRARIFHVDYQSIRRHPEGRPVTFVFNGGPGSSSVWLHLGAFGPRRVAADPEGFALEPPGQLVENAETLLPISGQSVKTHIHDAKADAVLLSQTLKAWSNNALGNLTQSLPEPLQRELSTDLPTHPFGG